jgi:putative flavoprotein involved in K+ transport
MTEAIVCGAGTAGLASAAALRAAGVKVVVLERTDRVGASWRTRYDDLRLNTPGWMSTQPGYRASRRRYGEYPTRDAWIRYLEDYAAHHRIDVRFGTQVRRLEPAEEEWRLETDGEGLRARFVVIATGFDHDPELPDWPGRDSFNGGLIHSSAYRNPEPYRGRDVLVVGPGTTGLGGRDAARAGRRREGARGLPDPAEPDGSQDHGRLGQHPRPGARAPAAARR